jgi:hypothetical protein
MLVTGITRILYNNLEEYCGIEQDLVTNSIYFLKMHSQHSLAQVLIMENGFDMEKNN